MDEFGDTLSPTDKLGAYGNVYAGKPDDLAADIRVFVDLAVEHHVQFTAGSRAAAAWARGTKHSLVNVPIRTLLAGGHVDAAMQLLRAWRGAPNDAPRPQPLIAMFATDHGTAWVADGNPWFGTNSGPGLEHYQTVSNAFLRTTVTVSTSPEMTVELPERGRGIPNEDMAEQYLQTLRSFLDLNEADRAYNAIEPLPTSLLLIPGLQAPVQALMIRDLGWTLPLTASLEQPAPDRRITQVVLFLGSLLGEREQEILAGIFAASDIVMTVRRDADLTRQQFIEDYESPLYDVVWVGTHGVFDGLQPDNAHLHLSETERVHLDDLQPPAADNRRLLVLNACDGAVTAANAGVGEIGLAAYASTSAQAVVSHLWPVESSTTALMFAGVLAHSLVSHSNFFDAYQTALRILGDPTALREHVSSYSRRLAQLIDDRPHDFERLTAWGSAAFVE